MPCFWPLGDCIQVFTIKNYFSCRFLMDDLHYVEKIFILVCWAFFKTMNAFIPSNVFSPSMRWSYDFFLLINVVNYIDFQILNQRCIPGINICHPFFMLLDSLYFTTSKIFFCVCSWGLLVLLHFVLHYYKWVRKYCLFCVLKVFV